MAVVLDSRDLALVDREFAVQSQVWDILRQGGRSVTEADFVGVNQVRVNMLSGFENRPYTRNGDNARTRITVDKEVYRLEREDWMGYDLDILDQSENASYATETVIEEHTTRISIPQRDQHAVARLWERSQSRINETITAANALTAYDAAEQFMVDNDIVGPFVMFVSSDYYRHLKNAEGVGKSFTTNTVQLNGIDRTVATIDGEIPIIKVSRQRLQVIAGQEVNFILVPLRVAAPVVSFMDVEVIPASQDADGYRDKIKGLIYYDLIVFENARKAVYISFRGNAGLATLADGIEGEAIEVRAAGKK